MDVSPPPSDDYLVVITQLVAEKDRLVTEKDELVVSKDRLWREMHQIIQEKNERIEELFNKCTTASSRPRDDSEVRTLRDEIRRLERRNWELEKALRDALETDDDDGEDIMETSSSSGMLPKSFSDLTNTENIEYYPNATGQAQASSTTNHDPLLQLRTPTSTNVPVDDAEYIAVASRPRTSVKILPVIQSDSFIQHTFGRLNSLDPAPKHYIETARNFGA